MKRKRPILRRSRRASPKGKPVTGFRETLTALEEPLLEFAYGQHLQAPHDGLAIFGPYDLQAANHPKSIVLGLLATPAGRQKFTGWLKRVQKPVYPGLSRWGNPLNPILWPVFPGFEAVFDCTLPEEPAWVYELQASDLEEICSDLDSKKRAFRAVEQYLSGIQLSTKKKDEEFHVFVCVIPDIVKQACRPQGRVSEGTGFPISKNEQVRRASGQTDLFEHYDPAIYRYSEDFRRQLKARSMQYDVPIQIIRESTLDEGTSPILTTTPPSDVAWNLLTTLYYKAGGKPWRLAGARPGVCYIGIAFRRTDPISNSRSACCAAQMFLDSGDGIVFLGDEGLWYSPVNREFHLSKEAAQRLLEGVLKTYHDLGGQPLTEIFLHSKSGISADEFEGYQSASPQGVKLVGVRVKREQEGLKFFREGNYPPLRGWLWMAQEKVAFLFSSGTVPRLGTYPGTETPVPLRIDVQHGESDIVQVARDILALTKLNYNACRFGEAEPVTIGFSSAVGEILVSNPTVKDRSPKFKFYI